MKKGLFLVLFYTTSFFTVNAQYTILRNLASVADGSQLRGSLISDGTFLYGMAWRGGTVNMGTIFKMMPDGSGFIKLMDFTGAVNGSQPCGSLVYDGNFLYGMTSRGGINDQGVVFKILTDGTGYLKLLDFDFTNGSSPIGDLFFDGTFLYGMTLYGGINGLGTIFKIKTDGTGYSRLKDFSGGPDGGAPWGSFVFDGNYLYGTTAVGGTDSIGVIFKIKTDGTGYYKLLDFNGIANGSNPLGSLCLDGTFLYGITYQGGLNNFGTIFKIRTDGSGYLKLHDFTGLATGKYPYGYLISEGAFLYGMTYMGGVNTGGVMYKIMNDGSSFTILIDFECTTTGGASQGSLFSDGTFLYGMLGCGLTGSVIFKYYDVGMGITENNPENNFTFFPNPSNGIFKLNSNFSNGEISICNLLGEIILQSNINNPTSTIQHQQSISPISPMEFIL